MYFTVSSTVGHCVSFHFFPGVHILVTVPLNANASLEDVHRCAVAGFQERHLTGDGAFIPQNGYSDTVPPTLRRGPDF
jgi:hypothetical protein